MYINSVLSFLGAWKELEEKYPHVISEIEKALLALSANDYFMERPIATGRSRDKILISPSKMNKIFLQMLGDMGWELNARNVLGAKNTFLEVDAIKNGIAVELSMGRWSFVGSYLLTKFPFFIRAKKLHLAVVLVPMKSLTLHMSVGVSSFELIHDLLNSAHLPLKYPFAIVGFSTEQSEPQIVNLTTELDEYLVQNAGYTLDEMLLLHEMENYDFKAKFTGGDRFCETVCAFSNLPEGGMFLFGVTDDCVITGLSKGKELDGIRLGISNILNNGKHLPQPGFTFHTFDVPTDPNLCIFIMRIHSSEIKPCIFDGRVYVRSGPSTQVATPEQIRQLVLG